jgi:hypothetical protein
MSSKIDERAVTGHAPGAYTPRIVESPGRAVRGRWWTSVSVRLFLTVWIVYVLHFATNVVRETYLAMTLGERFSVRVDEYMGLHPDLFEIEGRGAYINNNPGASMLGAIPYAVAYPVLSAVLRANPALTQPKPPSEYDDPRPNRTRFMNEARARGLDVKLALAAAVMHAGLMAPLGALAAVVVFGFLRARLRDDRLALGIALLYAFVTPIFFRSAFLNQNAILAHCVLFAFLALTSTDGWGDATEPDDRVAVPIPDSRAVLAGALLGLGVLNDYSGVPMVLAFGVWILVEGWRAGGARSAIRAGLMFSLGGLGPLVLLLAYQWAAFGNPLFPAQRYMPPTRFSVHGWNGLTLPTAELLWRNLFDPRYGLFVFCPMLLAALAAPFVRRDATSPPRGALWLIFGASAALWLFNSANQFANLQWNTGVRYMVPAGALLFFAALPVLRRLPTAVSAALVVLSVVTSWSTAMARESVPVSLARVFTSGFELPWLEVLEKTADAYAPFLEHGTSPLPLFVLTGAVMWLLWRRIPLARRSAADAS